MRELIEYKNIKMGDYLIMSSPPSKLEYKIIGFSLMGFPQININGTKFYIKKDYIKSIYRDSI